MTTKIINFAAGASLSTEELGMDSARHLAGIAVPVGWTGTTITFAGSADVSPRVFTPVVGTDGTEVKLTVAAGTFVTLPADLLLGASLIKVRSGTNAAPVNQASAAVLPVVMRVYS